MPFGDGLEYDGVVNYAAPSTTLNVGPQPHTTELVNAAISAFAMSFPLQSPRLQGSILEQILSAIASSPASMKEPMRRTAVNTNVAVALLLTAQVLQGHSQGATGQFQSPSGEAAAQAILYVSNALHQDRKFDIGG